MVAILSSATASAGRSPDAEAIAVFAFIHDWSGQSGSGLVPQVGPASTAGAAAVALAGALAVAVPPAFGAEAVAAVGADADAEGAALTDGMGMADIAALAGADGGGEGSTATGDASAGLTAVSVFGHATRESPRTIISAGKARMASDSTRPGRPVSLIVTRIRW